MSGLINQHAEEIVRRCNKWDELVARAGGGLRDALADAERINRLEADLEAMKKQKALDDATYAELQAEVERLLDRNMTLDCRLISASATIARLRDALEKIDDIERSPNRGSMWQRMQQVAAIARQALAPASEQYKAELAEGKPHTVPFSSVPVGGMFESDGRLYDKTEKHGATRRANGVSLRFDPRMSVRYIPDSPHPEGDTDADT